MCMNCGEYARLYVIYNMGIGNRYNSYCIAHIMCNIILLHVLYVLYVHIRSDSMHMYMQVRTIIGSRIV